MRRIWIDVEDLFGYARAFRRPSGIQRTVLLLSQALIDQAGTDIRFLRHAGQEGFSETDWSSITTLVRGMTASADPAAALTNQAIPGHKTMDQAWRAQRAALATFAGIPATLHRPRRVRPPDFRTGDTLLVAGAGWDEPTHARRLLATRRRFGLDLALLLHDLIPLRRPEWCTPQTSRRFAEWAAALLPEADLLLANSEFTAIELSRHMASLGLSRPGASVIRLGDCFTDARPIADSGDYALFVSTLEIRKNHALLVEAWRILLERRGPGRVPKLVFAGRAGALVEDLLRTLEANRYLDGHIVLEQDLSDEALAGLYRGCAFTLFPSLYEGWGLPVAESLCFGAPCLAARATSIPEVGGDLVRYFDPMDLSDALRAIEAVLDDPRALARWRREIAAGFQPATWNGTAQAILAAVGARG